MENTRTKLLQQEVRSTFKTCPTLNVEIGTDVTELLFKVDSTLL